MIRVLSDKVKKDWSCYDLIWNSIKLGTENREFSEFFGLWGFKFFKSLLKFVWSSCFFQLTDVTGLFIKSRQI